MPQILGLNRRAGYTAKQVFRGIILEDFQGETHHLKHPVGCCCCCVVVLLLW